MEATLVCYIGDNGKANGNYYNGIGVYMMRGFFYRS